MRPATLSARALGGGGAFALRLVAVEERDQRIGRHDRIEVEHEAVAVGPDGREREDLGLHLDLRSNTRRTVPGLKRPTRTAFTYGSDSTILSASAASAGAQLDVFEVEHQALGILEREDVVLDRGRRFERDARVVDGGPHARGADGDLLGAAAAAARAMPRTIRKPKTDQGERRASAARPRRAVRSCPNAAAARDKACPASVSACSSAVRPAVRHAQRRSSGPPAGSPDAFSGHSTRHTRVRAEVLAKPCVLPFLRIVEPIKIKVIQV